MLAPGACVQASANIPTVAPRAARRGLGSGCAVVGFAGGALGSQRAEHCASLGRSGNVQLAKYAGSWLPTRTAIRRADIVCSLVSRCLLRPPRRAGPHATHGPVSTNRWTRVGAWPACWQRGLEAA